MRDDRTYQTEPYMPQNPDSNVGDEYIVKHNPNLIEIPDDATNGDVIKAVFPYGTYGTNGNEVHVFGVGGNGVLVFTLDWWNAPYEAENE